jgi:hypothetical protein
MLVDKMLKKLVAHFKKSYLRSTVIIDQQTEPHVKQRKTQSTQTHTR